MGKARDYIPALKYGNKIVPEDIAGLVGQPQVGNIFYVDAVNGSDSANSGTSWDDAFASFGAAYTAVTSGNYDVIVIAPGGVSTGSGASVGSALTASKNLYTVIGAAAPSSTSNRSRILVDDATYSLTIAGSGVRFINVQLACFLDVNVPFSITGSRNYFGGCHIAGMGIQAAGDDTAGRNLVLTDADENLFEDCIFGLDTVDRGAANIGVEFAGGCQRNTFRSCMFQMAVDAATPVHVGSTGTSGLDRWQRFIDCVWYSFSANNATPITANIDVSAQTATGHLLLTGQQVSVGATDWEASASGRIYMQSYTATTTAIGLAINPT